jgi:hypothetical protein
MADFTLRIDMDDHTVEHLAASGMSLFVFKAVEAAGSDGGRPLTWIKSGQFGQQMTVTWEKQFQAYASTDDIEVDHRVVASNPYPMNLGDTFTINSQHGTGEVRPGGHPGAVTIKNEVGNSRFTCGISQMGNGGFAPVCAFPIFYEMTDLIAPVETVLVMFASDGFDTGTVIIQAFASAFLVDFTDPAAQTVPERTVMYNIRTGWDAGEVPWARPVEEGADLVSLLIQPSATPSLAHVGANATAAAARAHVRSHRGGPAGGRSGG